VTRIILVPVRTTRAFVRVAGLRGALLFLVGIAIGMLIAPTSGARLRARILDRLVPVSDELPADTDMVV